MESSIKGAIATTRTNPVAFTLPYPFLFRPRERARHTHDVDLTLIGAADLDEAEPGSQGRK